MSRFALGLGTLLIVLAAGASEAAVTTNKLASNKLASNKLASNKLASNKLASNRLASNALSATLLEADPATTEILATADGREVYSYIVGCALPESVLIEATVPGVADTAPPDSLYTCVGGRCTFQGSVGLAQHWIDRKLEHKGQRWVSACLLARVNAFETTESISLRGLAPELSVSTDEADLYVLQEGAFFGNLFTDGEEPIDWNACRGRSQAAGEAGGLYLRDCAEPDPLDPTHTVCGFNFAGDCADFSPESPGTYACRSVDDEEGTYGDCHVSPGDGRWPGLKPYREIITTYVSGN